MDPAMIARINELAKKKRTEGLSPEEAEEQQRLRAKYLSEFRSGMEEMLKGIRIQSPDGSISELKKKPGR